MSFFDKKEEVIEMKLTEYGKRKLQLGRLNPTFYAFFDDDILYNTDAAGFTEAQNHYKRPVVRGNMLFLKTLLRLSILSKTHHSLHKSFSWDLTRLERVT